MATQHTLFANLPVPAERQVKRFQPSIPHTGWKAPAEYPNLSGERVLGLDTETYDPELKTHGPGWGRSVGELVGFSLSTLDHKSWYFPLRHRVRPEENLPVPNTLAFLKDTLAHAQKLVGANLLYDLGWLKQSGITVPRAVRLYDVQYAQALLEQRTPVNLDYLAEKYLKEKKETNILYQWIRLAYGLSKKEDPRAEIYNSPPSLVGPYAEQDALLPIKLMPILGKKLQSDELYDLFKLECGLISLLVEMRFQGIPVSLDRTEEVRQKLLDEVTTRENKLEKEYKTEINVDAPTCLKILLKNYLHELPLTTKTEEPSFAASALESIDSPVVTEILEIRKLRKIISTFLEGAILKHAINGRIHCQFHQLRGDDNGTGYGRFSSSDPNLQQIPSRHPIYGPLLRSLFISDTGMLWSGDYKQIEYIYLIHFAIGAEHVIRYYNENPSTNYHKLVVALIKESTGTNIEYAHAKTINFGLLFGMQKKKLGKTLQLSPLETDKLFNAYHKGAPFIAKTMQYYQHIAETKKEIRTILNRRARFELYQDADDYFSAPLPYRKALRFYGHNIKIAYAYKAINHLLQGSAADQIKQAMFNAWHNGIFDVIGVPYLTVHDELDLPLIDTPIAEQGRTELKRIMETCILLRVPVTVDVTTGSNWGECK